MGWFLCKSNTDLKWQRGCMFKVKHPQYLIQNMSTGLVKLLNLVSLAKWLSVRLRTNWLWIGVPLQSLNLSCIVGIVLKFSTLRLALLLKL